MRYESDLVIIYAYHFVGQISKARISLSATLDSNGDLISPVTCAENIPAPDRAVIYDPTCSSGVILTLIIFFTTDYYIID